MIEEDLPKISALFDAGVRVSTINNEGESALMIAVKNGCKQSCQFLIEAGADKETKNSDGMTPLSIAAKCGHVEIVPALLVDGAKIDTVSNSGETPLTYALFNGHEDVVHVLLEAMQPLIHALISKLSWGTDECYKAAKSLARISGSEAIEALMECANKGEHCSVCAEAAKKLTDIRGRIVDTLLDLLNQDYCRFDIIEDLGCLNDRRAVDPLVEILERPGPYSQDEIACQRAAAIALGRIGDPRSVQPLIRAAEDGISEIAFGALEALKMIDDPRTSGKLKYWQRMIEGRRGFGM